MSENSHPLPDPDLKPQRINVEQYHCHAPEKFELLDGYLDNLLAGDAKWHIMPSRSLNAGDTRHADA